MEEELNESIEAQPIKRKYNKKIKQQVEVEEALEDIQDTPQEEKEEEEEVPKEPIKRKYVKKVKPPFEELPVEEQHKIEDKLYRMPKPRTEKQKIQFMQMQEKQQKKWLEKRIEKNAKIKEMVLKQIEVEKRNKVLNHRKLRKISNSIIDDEFATDDRQVLKKIIDQQKEKEEKEKPVDYSKFF